MKKIILLLMFPAFMSGTSFAQTATIPQLKDSLTKVRQFYGNQITALNNGNQKLVKQNTDLSARLSQLESSLTADPTPRVFALENWKDSVIYALDSTNRFVAVANSFIGTTVSKDKAVTEKLNAIALLLLDFNKLIQAAISKLQ